MDGRGEHEISFEKSAGGRGCGKEGLEGVATEGDGREGGLTGERLSFEFGEKERIRNTQGWGRRRATVEQEGGV